MVLKDVSLWSEKLKEGLELSLEFYAKEKARLPRHVKKIAFIGMGGSGIAGRILKTFLDRKAGVTTIIVDSPEIPAHLDSDTLAIVVSYSGNTW